MRKTRMEFLFFCINCTPLHIACLRKLNDIIEILLEQKNIDPNVENEDFKFSILIRNLDFFYF